MGAPPAVFPQLEDIFKNLINATFALAGLVSFVFILVGAFRYLNSGGDDKAVQAAKNTLTFAIVGLFIVVGGYVFFNTLLGPTILDYPPSRVPSPTDHIFFDIPQ